MFIPALLEEVAEAAAPEAAEAPLAPEEVLLPDDEVEAPLAEPARETDEATDWIDLDAEAAFETVAEAAAPEAEPEAAPRAPADPVAARPPPVAVNRGAV